MSDLSGLNPTPHAIAVYASRPLSQGVTQHSLPSGRCPLLGPVFHRLDRTSLPGALIRSPRRRGRAGSATSGVLPSFILGKHTHKRPVLRRYQQDAILGYRVIVAFGLRNIIGKIRRHRLQRNVRRQLYADIRIERSTSRLVPERLVDRPPFFVAKGLERVGERDQLVGGGVLLREFRRDGVGVCRRPAPRARR